MAWGQSVLSSQILKGGFSIEHRNQVSQVFSSGLLFDASFKILMGGVRWGGQRAMYADREGGGREEGGRDNNF